MLLINYEIHNHEKAIRFIEKILNDDAAKTHHKITTVAQVLHTLIHYEEGNFDLLEYLTRGLKNLNGNKKSTTATENLLIEFILNLSQLNPSEHKREFFSGYLKKFSALKENRFEDHNFDYFDITIWLRKKIFLQGEKMEKNTLAYAFYNFFISSAIFSTWWVCGKRSKGRIFSTEYCSARNCRSRA